MTCLFCAIVAGDIPSKQIYADDAAIAFLDIDPWQPGHALVVPRAHTDDVLAADADLAAIAPAVQAVGRLLVDRLNADGVNVLTSAGAVAGQEVFHLHLHVVPRYADRPGLANLTSRSGDVDLDAVLQRITRS